MKNILDEFIDWISPTAGLRRAQARALRSLVLSYDGSRSARRQGGRVTSNSSGNSEISTAGSKLRANARDLARNNAYGRRAKREWAKRVVGAGITPRPASGDRELDKLIKQYWDRWIIQCCSDQRLNFYACQKLIVQSAFEAGEVLVRLWNRRPEDGLEVPFQIQLLEADYLDSDITKETSTGYIINGVDYDLLGRIRGFWLWNRHPGEVLGYSVRAGLASKFIKVDNVLHHYEPDRPGDARAVTKYHAILAKLQDIAEYTDAEIVRKKIEACMTAFFTQADLNAPTAGAITTDSEGKRQEEFRPGLIMYGQPGEEVKFFEPPASGDFSDYKKTELREVAAGLDIPYVVLDDNLEAVNYSSYRGGMLSFRDSIIEYRRNWLIPQVLDPIYKRFIDTLEIMGKIPGAPYGVKWDPPPFDVLDRKAEGEADQIELQIGKTTWPQLVGRDGLDPDEQLDEIEKYKGRLDAAGVSFSKNTSGEAQPAPPPIGGEDDGTEE